MRLPQLKGWMNILALISVPILMGLKSAYDDHALNSWAMVAAAIESSFFKSLVPMIVGWLGMESPSSPHVYDAKVDDAPINNTMTPTYGLRPNVRPIPPVPPSKDTEQ